MEVTDLGPTQLKNIDKQICAYSLQVGVPGQPKLRESGRTRDYLQRLLRRRGVSGSRRSPPRLRGGRLPIAGGAWWLLDANRSASVATKTPAEAARLSIVALPFANLSGDPGQDYLVDAPTDELTAKPARLRYTFVIARNTAMTFRGKLIDAKAIGSDLGVRYVLEGSVQPSGDRMRVNALSSTPAPARICGPNNPTRPAPICCCRRRTRSSRVWRTQSAFSLPSRGLPSQTGFLGQSRRRRLGLPMQGGPIGRLDRSVRRRMRHTRSANRRSPSIPTMSAP